MLRFPQVFLCFLWVLLRLPRVFPCFLRWVFLRPPPILIATVLIVLTTFFTAFRTSPRLVADTFSSTRGKDEPVDVLYIVIALLNSFTALLIFSYEVAESIVVT